ncbi:MAG: arylsulfatase [Tannerellaceae bacterium]|jgi:arylsulfatase|nr:arylsulfatase [Tannerellaceae bacterium]
MEKKYLGLGVLLPGMALGENSAEEEKKDNRPNIILIVADDLGYSDLGAYGGEIHTPNIDKLAYEGIRFRQFYNNSISAPTRASLLTGQYATKAGIGYFSVNLGLPAYQGFLNKESLTLGEVLHQGGYQTYLSGKWHVGENKEGNKYPVDRGFDHSFGILGGASTYFYGNGYAGAVNPGPLVRDKEVISCSEDSNFYFTDEITEHAIQYINDAQKKKNPFFLYLAYTAPHWPLQARTEDIALYKGRYDVGWDTIRKQRKQRLKDLELIGDGVTVAEKDSDVPPWKDLTREEKKLWAEKMEIYAAMVTRMDSGIGAVIRTLREVGELENTLILFMSDNGAPAEEVAGQFGKVVNSGPIGTAGSFESQGVQWSHVSNTPFRGYKSYAYEGGICSPFIAWYPKHISGNEIVDGRGHIIDIAPTLYEIAKVDYPTHFNNTVSHKLPGKSLEKVLYTQTELDNRPLFWERAGNKAVRYGKYKLVSIYPSYKWQLYDLEKDGGETNDISSENLEIVEFLTFLYFDWAIQNDVVPFDLIRPKEPLLKPVHERGHTVY